MKKIFQNYNIQYLNEKGRFLLFAFLMLFVLFVSYFLFKTAYARYELNSKIVAGIDKALYIFDSTPIRFNLEPLAIIPSDDPYTYTFSVSNFNSQKDSDVDMSYHIHIRTTTNLPLIIKLYRNESYDDPGATDILLSGDDVRDSDGAWYHIYDSSDDYNLYYVNETTDVYELYILFPKSYANDETYANAMENIEVTLESRQII